MAEQAPSNNGQKKKKAFMIVGAVVAIGLIAGYFISAYNKTHISTDDAFIEGNIHTISARVSGSVKTVLVDDNQQVKPGDVLVETGSHGLPLPPGSFPGKPRTPAC